MRIPSYTRQKIARYKKTVQELEQKSGRVPVPEDIYGSFIIREIYSRNDEFYEARLIGTILGKYRPGIGDGWIAMRIEKMIEAGQLECVTEPPTDAPLYHRVLRKKTD